MPNINYTIRNATIPKNSWGAALDAVNEFLVAKKAKNWNCHKSRWATLEAFLQSVGFRIKEYPDYIQIEWVEKTACGTERFLSILAPYLNPDSVFECLDIDSEFHYRFVIRDGQLIIQSGKVVYEDGGTPVVY